MQFWFEPRVTLIARQEFLGAPHIKWESDSDVPAEQVVEFAGRICYASYGKDSGLDGGHKVIQGRPSNQRYIENILNARHGSVCEHATWTLLIEGVSRALTHELVRHRTGMSYSQLSQRYVDESEVGAVVPPEIREDSLAVRMFMADIKQTVGSYRKILSQIESKLPKDLAGTTARKRARQAARGVLPNAVETKIVVTGNARSWRHFLTLRGNEHADREIRELAVATARVLLEESPNLFQDVSVQVGSDGHDEVVVGFGTV